MFPKKWYGIIFAFWFSCFIGYSMVFAMAAYYESPITVQTWLNATYGVIFGYLSSLIIPTAKWNEKFVKLLNVKKNTIGWKLLFGIPACFTMSVLLDVFLTILNLGIAPFVWIAIIKSLPYIFVIAYIVSFVAEPLSSLAAEKMCREK